ncbi:MAG: disulfide bond formation protein B [Candidatus Ranarchaeia archaeon]|jgi:hypothetical protein
MIEKTGKPLAGVTARKVISALILLISYTAFAGSIFTEWQYLGIIAPCIWCTALRWIAFTNGGLAVLDIYMKFGSKIPYALGSLVSFAGIAISAFNVNLQIVGICLFNCVSVPVFGVDLFVWALGVSVSTFILGIMTLVLKK